MYIFADENPIFKCDKVQLKSETSGSYLHVVDSQINALGKKAITNSTFVVTKIKDDTLSLKTHDSRKIISSLANEYILSDNMDDGYEDNNMFTIKGLNDKKISLQSYESFYLSSDVNGFISQGIISQDSAVTANEMWSFDCFEGKSLYLYVRNFENSNT